MIRKVIGIKYSRGATKQIKDGGPALAPDAVHKMFPNEEWIFVTPDGINFEKYINDRFGENALIQQRIYDATPREHHILIGGDHSVNFGHFAAIADTLDTDDLCLVYIDAHLDIHTPESSRAEASGAPHGTNVRALLGEGDERWHSLQKRKPALKPENVFYLASRSYEPAEITNVRDKNIYIRHANELMDTASTQKIIDEIREKIGNRKFVVSLDFDAIDPSHFKDVLVPEPAGIGLDIVTQLVTAFSDAHSFEFVEYAPTGHEQSGKIAHDLIEIALKN
jgi:arginase family enzyme